MSIIISNITEREGKGKYGKGKQLYEVQINRGKPMFTYEHNFKDGLAVCLSKAASAAKEYEVGEYDRMLSIMQTLSEANKKSKEVTS